jgi:hypothetical protein
MLPIDAPGGFQPAFLWEWLDWTAAGEPSSCTCNNKRLPQEPARSWLQMSGQWLRIGPPSVAVRLTNLTLVNAVRLTKVRLTFFIGHYVTD